MSKRSKAKKSLGFDWMSSIDKKKIGTTTVAEGEMLIDLSQGYGGFIALIDADKYLLSDEQKHIIATYRDEIAKWLDSEHNPRKKKKIDIEHAYFGEIVKPKNILLYYYDDNEGLPTDFRYLRWMSCSPASSSVGLFYFDKDDMLFKIKAGCEERLDHAIRERIKTINAQLAEFKPHYAACISKRDECIKAYKLRVNNEYLRLVKA